MGICLKELRAASAGIKIINRGKLNPDMNEIIRLYVKSDELISIFVASIKTAKKGSK